LSTDLYQNGLWARACFQFLHSRLTLSLLCVFQHVDELCVLHGQAVSPKRWGEEPASAERDDGHDQDKAAAAAVPAERANQELAELTLGNLAEERPASPALSVPAPQEYLHYAQVG
jgi:hypothetical protein